MYITLEVDDKGSAVVRKFGDKSDKAFDKMKAKAKGASAGMGSSLQKLKQHWMAVTAATAAAVAMAKKSIEAFMRQEDAEMKLAVAMRNAGTYTRENLQAMKDYASGQQLITKYGDEVTLATMANLQTYGMSTEAMKAATKASMDLASAKGMDLKMASELVGKAFVGETGTLSRYGIILEKGIPQTEKFAAVLGLIEQRFGGTAQAELETYGGQWKKISNWWGDIAEKVGIGLLKTLEAVQFALGMALAGFYTLLEGATAGLAKFISYGEKIPFIGKQFKGVADSLKFNASAYKDAKDAVMKYTVEQYDMLVAHNKVEDAIDKMGSATKGATEKTKELNSAQKKAAEDAKKLSADFSDKYRHLTLGDYKYAVAKIRDQGKAYEIAGANRLQVAEWVSAEIAKLPDKEKEAAEKAAAEIQAIELKRHNILFAFETEMSQMRDNGAVRQLEFLGRQSEALDLQLQQQALLAERQYQAAIEMPGATDEDKLAATTTFLEAEYQLQAEYAQRKAELWWNNAQTYINFAQQMSTFAMQYLLAEGKDREAIGRRMLATSIRFMTKGLQQFMFTKAKEHLINAAAAAGYMKTKTIQAAAEMAIGGQMAAAWTAYFAAMSLNPLGGQAFVPAATAMAAATAGFGAAAAGVAATGAGSIAAELGMAAAWMAGGILTGAAGETAAAAIEGGGGGGEKTIGGGTGEGYTLSSPDEPQWQRQTASTEPEPVSRTITVNVYGNVVDHDKFARELVPAIRKAEADGV
jgi:hypothetical protein